MVCGKCKAVCAVPKDAIKCTECSSEFHATCSRVRTVAKLTGMSAKAVSEWKCDSCSHETASIGGHSDGESQTVLEILKNIQQELLANKNEHRAGFSSLEKAIEKVNETLGSVQARMSALEQENDLLKAEQLKSSSETRELAKHVISLQQDIEDLQQYSRNRNVELVGVPVTRGEDVYTILSAVAKVIGVPYNRADISTAHRLGKSARSAHPSIVVQFISRTTRAVWLAAARRRPNPQEGIQSTDLAASLPPSSVFLNEHLTGNNKAVLGYAKFNVKQKGLSFAWCRDGKVMVRKTEESPAVRVWSREDVDDVMAGARNNSK